MSEDKQFKMPPMPAFIKSMLEPFVNITHERLKEPPVFERTFISEMFRPEPEILEAIGRVATVWAVLERILGMALTRLALAPDFPTMALTKDLSLDNQLKAMKTLLALHAERYRLEVMSKALQSAFAEIPAKIWALKDERNIVIHTLWTRMGKGGVTSLANRPLSLSQASKREVPVKTAGDFNDLANRIQALADQLYMMVQLLPAVDERQHVESLSQEVDRLHREIGPKHPSPPEPSQA